MIPIKVLIGVTIFLLLVISALLIWIAFLRFDIDTLKRVNMWLYEDLEEANAKFKLAMGKPINIDSNEARPPIFYSPDVWRRNMMRSHD